MFNRRKIDWVALLIIAIAIALPAVIFHLAVPTPAILKTSPKPAPPPTAVVLTATRQLKLLTFAIDSTVTTTKTDESWRGTASATVKAPVRYHFGVDLSRTDDHNLSYNPLTRIQTLTIPAPVLIA